MDKKLVFILITAIVLITGVFFVFKNTPQKDNEVVFWTLQMSDFAPYINGVISDFEKQNPDVKIKWVDVPFSEGEKRTLASVLSDNPPDLVNLNPDFSATLAQKGALSEIPKEKTSQFPSAITDSLTYNGKIYSVPWYATSAVTIYNKELLNKSGIKVPETYGQMSRYAQSVKDKTGAYIMLPNITENDTMLKILNKYGVSGAEFINSKESIEVFALFKDLYAKNLIPKETVTITLQESLEKYMSGQIAYIQSGANFLNIVKENAPQIFKSTDVSEQFTGSNGKYDVSVMNLIIPTRAKQKDGALRFALFLTNAKNQTELAKLTTILPVNNEALKDKYFTTYTDNDTISKARYISAKQLNNLITPVEFKKNKKEIINLLNSTIQQIVLEKTTAQKGLSDLQKNWKTLEEK